MADQEQIYTETLKDYHDLIKHIESITGHIRSISSEPRPNITPWWRGHTRQCDWKLWPFVYRVDDGDPSYEASKATEFMLEAPVRYAGCPTEGDMVGWLQLMRHYGLPTRILDWTRSPLIALFFAVNDPKDDSFSGALWALNPRQLNSTQHLGQQIFLPDHPLVEQTAQRATHLGEGKYRLSKHAALAFSPKLIDIRMMVQQSVFTMHGTRERLEELTGAKNFLAKLEIPHSSKENVRAMLEHIGFSARRLFPDLDHLSADIM